MFYCLRFLLMWAIWWYFSDKRRWRELLVVGLFAGFLGSASDSITDHFHFWAYQKSHPLVCRLLDDIGIYVVVSSLFIQWLPRKRSLGRMILYWLVWTLTTVCIEWVHLSLGYMNHGNGWNLGWSFLCDWFLFWLIYKFHQLFRLSRLNGT
ncbi:MAG TPA: CBO0543 family protein [Bacilli bacterium]|nr:CBO0543 family protein [Bacilli bacterium]